MTILEVLEAAKYNLLQNSPMNHAVGRAQLDNAIALLEKGYGASDDFDDVVGTGSVEEVPEKES